ncbi:MAG: hypothetical protein PVS3B3_00030 [Ktedonobacteraceae bacterium]
MPDSTSTHNPTNTVVEETSNIDQTSSEAIELEELDEELIIEDFTIDGICGVY